jgi:hypothetical protein
MGKLNRNNFITWDGEFSPKPFVVTAVDDFVSMGPNDSFINIPILDDDTATFGINESSINITQQANPLQPAEWDTSAKVIKFYPPKNGIYSIEGTYVLKYKWKDKSGHLSNEALVTVIVTPRPTAWRGYAPSFSCLLSAGENTGYGQYAQLEQFYTDTNESVIPLALKANVVGDPDYLLEVYDVAACPLPTALQNMYVQNMATLGTIQVITFLRAGDPDQRYFINLPANTGESRTIQVEGGTYDQIIVEVSGFYLDTIVATISPSLPGGSAQQNATVQAGNQFIFNNVTLGTAQVAGEIHIS